MPLDVKLLAKTLLITLLILPITFHAFYHNMAAMIEAAYLQRHSSKNMWWLSAVAKNAKPVLPAGFL